MNIEWPNSPSWAALLENKVVQISGVSSITHVIDCGELVLPSGRLIIYDPALLDDMENPRQHYLVPSGVYPVKATVVDISQLGWGKRIWGNAYASLILCPGEEAFREILIPIQDGKPPLPDPGPGFFYGVGVDGGMICLIDEVSLRVGLPTDKNTWFDYYFEDWMERILDKNNVHGNADIMLPLAKNGENMIIVSTAWGDGSYPVIGGFGADGSLLRIHVDFLAIRDR